MTPSAITQSSSPASAASAGATLSDLIVQSLTRHSSSEAFVAGDRRLTYAQVRDLVSQYMGALSRRGVGLGVGVTMLSPNTPESWIVQAAPYLLGGRFTGLQALASVQDQIVVCEDAEAAVLVVSALSRSTAGRSSTRLTRCAICWWCRPAGASPRASPTPHERSMPGRPPSPTSRGCSTPAARPVGPRA
ncbi:AMP-binding protein [Nonomuraea sp. NPDC050680]|uniref:AMP-binding protein n=1 Tax=Nonomuraea sp. NPDC050680 TaxID=3154630 RepID=UPI0033D19983